MSCKIIFGRYRIAKYFVFCYLPLPHTGKQKSEDCNRSYEKVNEIILDVYLFFFKVSDCAAF